MPLTAPIILKGQAKLLEPIVTLLMAIYQLLEEKDIGTIYGMPVTTFQDTLKFHPQVKLFFYEEHKDAQEIDNKKIPVRGEITFRLFNETEKTINETKAKAVAEKIKTKFVTGNLFTWHKGKLTASYLDKAKGYDFRLRVISEAEAKKIIEQVLDIQGHSPDWENLSIIEKKADFPTLPDKQIIYGSSKRLPRRRPSRVIKFRYAELHIWGLPSAITLVDTTGYRPAPLATTI